MTTIQIKKDGQDPQVINVPEGAKIIIEDGVTIVEPEFKKGDFIFDPEHGSVQIYSGSEFVIAQLFLKQKSLFLSGWSEVKLSNARLATESERQLLIDALTKDGKQWNPDTKQIEELKYIPKDGDCVEFDTNENNDKKGYFVAKIINGEVYEYGDWLAVNHTEVQPKTNLSYSGTFYFRKITTEELQSKFNELGYEYNFETHTAKKLRWKPKVNEAYYVPAPDQKSLYYRGINNICEFDTYRINKNIAFKTPEEAIEVAKRWLQQL